MLHARLRIVAHLGDLVEVGPDLAQERGEMRAPAKSFDVISRRAPQDAQNERRRLLAARELEAEALWSGLEKLPRAPVAVDQLLGGVGLRVADVLDDQGCSPRLLGLSSAPLPET